MQKSKPVAYVTYRIRTTDRVELLDELQHYPLKNSEKFFIQDIIAGCSYKDLANKYNLTESAIYQKKRKLYENIYTYLMVKH